MDWLQIILLALVQGLTEFLPISSSAHLILVAEFGAWGDQGLPFDVAVHLGTLSAVCLYFRQDLGSYARSGLSWLGGDRSPETNRQLEDLAKIAVASLPVAIAGLLLNDLVQGAWRSLSTIAWATIGFGILLGIADRFRGTESNVSWSHALVIGLSRTSAARFSFLLSIPTIAGAALLTGIDLAQAPQPAAWLDLLLGASLAGISAYLCISAFIALVEKSGMLPYVVYRLVLGVFLLSIAIGT